MINMLLLVFSLVAILLLTLISLPQKESNTSSIDFKERSYNIHRLDVDSDHQNITLLCPEMTTPSGIAWFHNGRRMHSNKSTNSIIVREESHTENVIGVYQCFVFNSTHEFSQLYKVELNREFTVLNDQSVHHSTAIYPYCTYKELFHHLPSLCIMYTCRVHNYTSLLTICHVHAYVK